MATRPPKECPKREYLERLGYRTYRFEADRLIYCPSHELQPEAWLDVIALPDHWQTAMKSRIDESWDHEAFVHRCLEWGRSEHKPVRKYLYNAMKGNLDFPHGDQRIEQLVHELAQEF